MPKLLKKAAAHVGLVLLSLPLAVSAGAEPTPAPTPTPAPIPASAAVETTQWIVVGVPAEIQVCDTR